MAAAEIADFIAAERLAAAEASMRRQLQFGIASVPMRIEAAEHQRLYELWWYLYRREVLGLPS